MQTEKKDFTLRFSRMDTLMLKTVVTRHKNLTMAQLVHKIIRKQLKGVLAAALSKNRVRLVKEIDAVYSTIANSDEVESSIDFEYLKNASFTKGSDA